MPGMHLMMVAKRFENYRLALDKNGARFSTISCRAGRRREETLVMHPNHTEAALMNAMIEMEMRIEALEKK